MITTVAAGLSLGIWLYLAFGRGGFWRVSKSLAKARQGPELSKRVAAVIPARNEAALIGRAIDSLLHQDYAGHLNVIVVDDASTDGTADAAGRATVVRGRPLPAGWTGKVWALSQGIEVALTSQPDYLLLTDADIHHGPRNVAELVSVAEQHRLDLVSYMVKLECSSFAEHALIPAFVFFFLMLHPPAWIASHTRRTAGAAGGCVLIRPSVLERIGGIAAIRDAIIDDCTLARAVKRAGGSISLALTEDSKSVRRYGTFSDIGHMISRTAFTQLDHSPVLVAGTLLGLLLVYVVPPVAVAFGKRPARLFGAIAWAVMSICFRPMTKFYGQNAAWSLALPAIAVFYAGATVHSALTYWRGTGGLWKDRIQDARRVSRCI